MVRCNIASFSRILGQVEKQGWIVLGAWVSLPIGAAGNEMRLIGVLPDSPQLVVPIVKQRTPGTWAGSGESCPQIDAIDGAIDRRLGARQFGGGYKQIHSRSDVRYHGGAHRSRPPENSRRANAAFPSCSFALSERTCRPAMRLEWQP